MPSYLFSKKIFHQRNSLGRRRDEFRDDLSGPRTSRRAAAHRQVVEVRGGRRFDVRFEVQADRNECYYANTVPSSGI